MSTASSSLPRAAQVDLEDFFTAALNAVERAQSTRAAAAKERGVDIDDIIRGGTTIGIWEGPHPTWPEENQPLPRSRRKGDASISQLRSLRTKERLDSGSLRTLSERASDRTSTAMTLMHSLHQDFAGTLDYLFDLSEDEQAYLEDIAVNAEAAMEVPVAALTSMVNNGAEIVEVEPDFGRESSGFLAAKKKEATKDGPFKFTVEGGYSEEKGVEITAKFEWTFG